MPSRPEKTFMSTKLSFVCSRWPHLPGSHTVQHYIWTSQPAEAFWKGLKSIQQPTEEWYQKSNGCHSVLWSQSTSAGVPVSSLSLLRLIEMTERRTRRAYQPVLSPFVDTFNSKLNMKVGQQDVFIRCSTFTIQWCQGNPFVSFSHT